jgi:cytidylate kinase
MPILTIARGSFSGGKMLAENVARRLGYRCIDREDIIRKAAFWGVSQEALRTAIEKPPSFLGQSQHTKYIYLAFIQAALTEEVRNGDAVYHGLAGHLLLGSGPHLLRIRIIAPMDYRAARVQERLGYSRKEAIAYIEKMDEERRKWTRFLYDVDWADSSLYDVVLNLEQMSLEEASDAILAVAKLRCFEFTAESRRAIEDLALASQVKAHLAMDPATSDLQFEVTAEAGMVSIKGDIVSPVQAKHVGELAGKVPGVSQVLLKELELATRF